MALDEIKIRMISQAFDLAGQFISNQITDDGRDEVAKAKEKYYNRAIEIIKQNENNKENMQEKNIKKPVEEMTYVEMIEDERRQLNNDDVDLTDEKIEGGTACLPCVPPDTIILTNQGSKRINELSVGDFVLDKDGEWTKIKKVFNNKYNGKIYDIQIKYQNTPITVTPEHPILINNGQYVKPDALKKSMFLMFPRLTKVEDIFEIDLKNYCDDNYLLEHDNIQIISKNNYLLNNEIKVRTQRVGRKIKQIIPLNNDFMRIIGFYLAEGCISNDKRGKRIRFSFGKHEKEYIGYTIKTIKELFGINPKKVNKKTGTNVEIYSKIIANYFSQFGINSHSKKIPKEYLYLSKEKHNALLEGYYKGDGYIRKKEYNNISCTTVSSKLANALKIILIRYGIVPSFYELIQKDTQINGRIIKSNGKRYILDCWGQSAIKLIEIVAPKKIKKNYNINHSTYFDDKYVYYPIKNISIRDYDGCVLNIETESNSYIANGIITHNCSRDHFSTVSGALNEAIRFSRDEGVSHPEVMRRIGTSLDELNSLERWDLSSENIERLKGTEKKLAEWGLKKSRDLRHMITSVKNHEDLEHVSAEASRIRTDFMTNLWNLATDNGSLEKLCSKKKGAEREKCLKAINEVLENKKEIAK